MTTPMETTTIKGLTIQHPASSNEPLKIGDQVKVLIKNYGDEYKSYRGVIIGFDDFKNKPAINICYIDSDYSSAEVKFVSYTENSKNCEVVKDIDATVENLEKVKSAAEKNLAQKIQNKHQELREAQNQLMFFQAWFQKTHQDIKELQGKSDY